MRLCVCTETICNVQRFELHNTDRTTVLPVSGARCLCNFCEVINSMGQTVCTSIPSIIKIISWKNNLWLVGLVTNKGQKYYHHPKQGVYVDIFMQVWSIVDLTE